jgi:hypothetical protein
MTAKPVRALKIFFCYAHEDEHSLHDLEKFVYVLRRLGQISTWSDRDIAPGMEWDGACREKRLCCKNNEETQRG